MSAVIERGEHALRILPLQPDRHPGPAPAVQFVAPEPTDEGLRWLEEESRRLEGASPEAILTWAAEGVAAEESPRLQGHLALCADCRRYAEELRAAAAGLRWLADRPAEPSPGFRARWTRALLSTSGSRISPETTSAPPCWQDWALVVA